MAVYTNDLRLTELATGEGSGTWGVTTNTSLSLIGEAFSFGTEAITTNADTHTTTIADGSTDPGRSLFLKYTGTLDSTCTITIGPNTVSKLWFIENATSGSQSIIIKQGSGATVTIANGQVKAIYSDGAGSGGAMVDAFQDLSVPDLFIDDDLTFTSDSAVISFGADADTTLTHTDGSGLTLNSTNKIMFNDASQFIQGSSATVLSLGATDEIDLTATAIDVNGTMDVSGALTGTSATFTTADNTAQMVLKSTDADSGTGPILDLQRDSGSPADSDLIGFIRFRGDDDGGNVTNYATIQAQIADVTGGTEDGTLKLQTMVAGSVTTGLEIAGGNVDISGALTGTNATFTTADNTAQLTVRSTDADATVGPIIVFDRLSSSPADSDVLGRINFNGQNDASEEITYAQIDTIIEDASDGTEDAQVRFRSITAGTARSRMEFLGAETVFNESSRDIDFRVESDGSSHMLFVDAGNNRVAIGEASPDTMLHATTSSSTEGFKIESTAAGATAGPFLKLDRNSSSPADDDGLGYLDFDGRNSAGETLTYATFRVTLEDEADGSEDGGFFLSTKVAGTTRSRISGNGTETVFNQNSADIDFRVESDGNTHMLFVDAGNNQVAIGTSTASSMLTVAGDITAISSGPSISLVDSDNNPDYQIKNGNGSLRFIDTTNSVDLATFTAGEVAINEGSADVDFRVESDARTHMFYVDSTNSKIGVGTNVPGCATGGIHLVHDSTEGTPSFGGGEVGVFQRNFNSAQGSSIALVSGTAASSVIKFGDKDDVDIGKIDYDNSNNSMSFFTNTTRQVIIDQNGNMQLGTTDNGPGSPDGIVIHHAGANVQAITTNSTSASAHYIGRFYSNTSEIGSIYYNGSATAYNTSSDYRLKENVTALTDATTRLKQLAPKRFNFIRKPDTTVDGFLAHEVSSIVPEAITGEKDAVDTDGNPEYQGIDQSKLVPLLVATIQELEARIAALEET